MQWLFLSGLWLVAVSILPVKGHVGERIFPIWELPTSALPDLHDHSLVDWPVLAEEDLLTRSDFASIYSGGGAFGGYEEDLEVNVRLGWSHALQRIYVSCERFDDEYINTYAAETSDSLWKHDGLDFWIDGDHSGGPYDFFPIRSPAGWDTLRNFQAQSYTVAARRPSGGFIEYAGRRAWIDRTPFAGVSSQIDLGYPVRIVTEFFVTPFDEIDLAQSDTGRRSVLAPGQIIGFQMAIREFDRVPGEFKDYWTLDRQSYLWEDADRFVDGVLLPCFEAGCSGMPTTLIQQDSWARIKASFW